MNPHELTDDLILRSLLGELSPNEQGLLTQALASAPGAAARMATFRSALGFLKDSAALENQMQTTEVQRERLVALMKGREASWLTKAADRAMEIVATVVAGSVRTPVLGFRGGATAGGIVRAEADGVWVDLRFLPAGTPDAVIVQGQIESEHAPRALRAVNLVSDAAASCNLEADGYFELRLSPGPHRFEIACDGVIVVIESLEVSRADTE